MKATSLDFRYDPVEDRLVITAHAAQASPVLLLITRRFTRALLSKLLEMLMSTSDAISRAPAQHREEVLLLEHVTALAQEAAATAASGTGDAGGGPAGRPKPGAAPAMVERVTFTLHKTGFGVSLAHGTGLTVEMEISRAEAHRLVSLLVRKALEAEWNLGEMEWLDRRRHVVMPETALVS